MKTLFLLSSVCLFISTAAFADEFMISCSHNSDYGNITTVYKINDDSSVVTTSDGLRFTSNGSACGNICGSPAANYITNINNDEIVLTTEFTNNNSEEITTISRITGEFSKYNSYYGTDYTGSCTKASRRF